MKFVEEEYDYINWDKSSLRNDDEHIAVWGWDKDGTYIVALALYYERTDEEVEERIRMIHKGSVTDEDRKFHKSGWTLKCISEVEMPVIQPSRAFLKNRPALTLEAKKNLKNAEELSKIFNDIEMIHTDIDNEGIIESAESCGDGQVFIWTTKGNYYISESAFNSELAIGWNTYC